MQRDEAVRRFGHHYTISAYDRTVYEVLGEQDDKNANTFASKEDALEALSEQVREQARQEMESIDRRLNLWRNKWAVFRAGWGFHKRADAILKAYDDLHEKRMAAKQTFLMGANLYVEPLPENVRLPVLLEPGRKIYRLSFSTHMNRDGSDYDEESLSIDEEEIIHCRLYPFYGRGDEKAKYDYHLHYGAGERGAKRADFGFDYDHDDLSETEIETNYSNTRYFLTREAAEEAALAMIKKLTGNFNNFAAKIAERRAATPVPAQSQTLDMT